MKQFKVPVSCSNCGHSFQISVKEMVPGRSKRCTKCSCTIQFNGDDGRKVPKALDDLEKTIQSFGKQKITIGL